MPPRRRRPNKPRAKGPAEGPEAPAKVPQKSAEGPKAPTKPKAPEDPQEKPYYLKENHPGAQQKPERPAKGSQKSAKGPKAPAKPKAPEDPEGKTYYVKENHPGAQQKRLGNILCVDILNQFNIRLRKSDTPRQAIKKKRKQIRSFVKLCKLGGYLPIGFIDHSISSQETDEKWRSRRIAELKKGKRDVLVGSQAMLGEMFQNFGVTVHFSSIDCDDTIAAFAYHFNGAILSQDKDFFRYYARSKAEKNPPYVIYSSFTTAGGRLNLKTQEAPRIYPRGFPPRLKLLDSLPKTHTSTSFLSKIPAHEKVREETSWMLCRGCGSILTQELNPHIIARPLRRALYSKMEYGCVFESLAHWDPEKGATFLEELVYPDETLAHLLDDPKKAFQEVFGAHGEKNPEVSDQLWQAHIFSQKTVIAELCAWAHPTKGLLEILKEI